MKSYKPNIKKTIKKRIELQMKDRQSLRVSNQKPKSRVKPIHVGLADRTLVRRGIPLNRIYQKKEVVDYDVVICIPSFDRYKKVKRLISQFNSTAIILAVWPR